MADDPWASFPIVRPAPLATTTAPPPADNPWAAFPIVKPAPAPATITQQIQQQTAAPPDTGGSTWGSILSSLVPGMGAQGWGPQNYQPQAYGASDAAVHGATLGLSDIVRGGAKDLTRWLTGTQNDYGGGGELGIPTQTDSGIADIKTDRDRYAAEHPYANIAANVAGSLATAPLLPVGRALGAVARIADPALRRLAGFGTSTAIGGGLGGITGAVDEAPAGVTPAAYAAARGLTIGGALGAASYPIAAGLGTVAQRVGDYFASRPALSELGVERPALSAVQRALESDDAFAGGQGADNIARAGPYGMAADAGPTALGMLDEAISGGGPGALTARNAVNQRATAANQTLSNALDAALGPPQGIATTRQQIRVGGAPDRATAYGDAYAQPIDYSSPAGQDLDSLLQAVPPRAIGHANELIQAERAGPPIKTITAEDGTVSFASPLTVQQVDYLTRGLGRAATESEGALGGVTDTSAAFQNLAGQIRSTLGGPRGNRSAGMVPEYGRALDTAADDISRSQAVKFGGDMLSPSTARDVVAMRVGHMSDPELEAVRQGMRSQIDERIANVNNAVSNPSYDAAQALAGLRQLNSQAVQEKMAMVMDPIQMAQLQRQLDIATQSAALYAGTVRNSATAGRLATREAITQATEPGVLGLAAEGRPVEAPRRLWQMVTGYTPQEKLAMADRTRGQIADLLTRQRDPATGRSVVDSIEGILPGLARSANFGGAVAAAPQSLLPAGVLALRGLLTPSQQQPPNGRGLLYR